MISATCLTCRSSFENAAAQRDHYKSEWHRYNLKRKILNLFPIDYDIFLSKSRGNGNPIEESEALYCKSCNKTFLSKNSFEAHIKSKKHINSNFDKTKIKNIETDIVNNQIKVLAIKSENEDTQSIASEKSWATLSSCHEGGDNIMCPKEQHIKKNQNHTCLFCTCKSHDTTQNLHHMLDYHGFFIPFESSVVDIDGYLNYLSYKINFCNICLWCSRTFKDTLSCQKHVTDKGHYKLKFERGDNQLLEYLQFYSKKNIKDISDKPVKLAKAIDRIFLPVIQVTGQADCGVNDDTFEMALPNGTILGHRSLNVYYKQNMSSYGKASKQMKAYKLQKLYASSHLSQLVQKRFRGAHLSAQEHKRLTKRDIKRDRRNFVLPFKAYHKRQLKIMTQANNQAHFRQQVDF